MPAAGRRRARGVGSAASTQLGDRKRAEFERRVIDRERPAALAKAIASCTRRRCSPTPQTVATRKASEMALEALVPAMPELLLGSADLTAVQQHQAKAAEGRLGQDDFDGPLSSITASARWAWRRR